MYSDISMRIMAFSSSNRHSASAFASSVLPTPVGPRNKKLPIGCSGSASPARLRRIAPGYRRNGLVLSNHSLMQTILKIDELFHFALHHLRDRDARPRRNHLGDLVFSDLLFQDGAICLTCLERCSRCFQLFLRSGMRPKRSSEARARSPSRVARSSSSCAASISAFKFWTETMESFSFFHSALRLSSDS